MSRVVCLAFVVAACFMAAASAKEEVAQKKLHIGVVPIPEFGHITPMLAVVDEALRRGHTIDIYLPSFVINEFDFAKAAPGCNIVDIGHVLDHTAYTDKFFEALVKKPALETFGLIEEEQRKYHAAQLPAMLEAVPKQRRPDVLFVDFGTEITTAIGEKFGIPVVLCWPLTLAFPVQQDANIPSLATALRADMTAVQKVGNYLFQRFCLAVIYYKSRWLNQLRAEHDIAPMRTYDEMFYRYPIITPSIFGLDLAQPLCPNVFPVGFMLRELPALEADSQESLDQWVKWMDSCDEVFYWNMGSVAQTAESLTKNFEDAIQIISEKRPGVCNVWKASKMVQSHLTKIKSEGNVRLQHHFAFSPRHLLEHKKMSVFVTHCGDTSVYEAVDAGVPMVGIPLFADQPDMCARVEDAEIGVALHKETVTAEQIAESVLSVANRKTTIKAKLTKLRAVGNALGGTKRAVDVLEHAAEPWFNDMLVCGFVNDPFWERFDIDVNLATGLVIYLIYVVIKKSVQCCCCRPRGKAPSKKKVE